MTSIHTIHNLEFAQKQLTLHGHFSVFTLKRLTETLEISAQSAEAASIHFELKGDSKAFRHPSLHLHINAHLPAICQRCLSEMQIPIHLDFDYLISQTNISEHDAADENDETDWLEADAEMDLQTLIEDELLLALPIAPVHAHPCTSVSMQSGEKPNPFAILKDKIK